jgi:hypothetical protein
MDQQGKYTATLWENGSPKQLSKNYSEAISVCTSSGNVYVAGWEFEERVALRPVLWVNGAPHYLPSENPYWAQALSVYVSDGDVYVAGYEGDVLMGDDMVAKVWVNGQGHSLGLGLAQSIFASNGNIYVVGLSVPLSSFATLWTNDDPQPLPPFDYWNTLQYALSVFASGGDVYVAGSESGDIIEGTLWKNGVPQRVGGGQGGDYLCFTEASSVFVSGNDIYVAGYEYKETAPFVLDATIWKNNDPQRLDSDRSRDAIAASVFVTSSGDMYAVGAEIERGKDRDIHYPRLWKNGAQQGLGGETPGSTALSVSVVEKAE